MEPPPPELIDEILLRLPPDEPQHLFRACLVCKSWLRTLTDPDFHRRYCAFHRTPPVLGLFHGNIGGGPARPFKPTTAAPLTTSPYFSRALDCHHGRVVLNVEDMYFVVWDPITCDHLFVPDAGINWIFYSAAVFCAATGCDHIDCHGRPFRIVLIATDENEAVVKATVYSSETGAWSTPVQHYHDVVDWYVTPRRGAVIGDEIFFTVPRGNAIVQYDLGKNSLSMINPPPHRASYISLMDMGDNALGFAWIEGSSLKLWSRMVGSQAAAEWMQCRVIKLDGMIPGVNSVDGSSVVGYAEGLDVIFVATPAGLFTFKLNSGKVVRIDDARAYFTVLPYMRFYTPGCGTLSSVAR